MTEVPLVAQRHTVADALEGIEFCYRMGWTDGLPVVPPTEPRVRACLEHAGLSPETILGELPERGRTITAEKVAINAVMAGCLPAYTPVVVAALEAMLRPAFSIVGMSASTGGAATLIIVSGPIAKGLGINSGGNVFGPGWRANATIGRAIRLILMNACGASPGIVDRSTLGHPGKYTYCIAEDEARSPWAPLRVELGFPAEASTVTVMAAEGPHHVNNHVSNTPEGLLMTCVDTINATAFGGGKYALVLCPEHLAVIQRARWSRHAVQEFVAANAFRSVADLKRHGRLSGEVEEGDAAQVRCALASPDDLIVVASGGDAGGFSAIVPPWGGGPHSLPQTVQIRERTR